MSISDLEQLLQPVSDDKPCGADLEYDLDFIELEKVATPTPERAVGDSVIAAVVPDWKDVRQRALKLFGRTKDIRLAIRLTEASLQLDGVPGFHDSVALLRALVDRYWDDFHPRLDPDDDLDPTMRINILLWMTNEDACLQVLTGTPLIDLPGLHKFSYRDHLVTTNKLPPRGDETPLAEASVDAAFAKVDVAVLQEKKALLDAILDNVTCMEAAITAKVGVLKAASFDSLTGLLRKMAGVLAVQLQKRGVSSSSGDDGSSPEAQSAAQGSAHSGAFAAPGEIRSRQDVIAVLEKICEFYRSHEPASPVPILLRRAIRLAAMMDFKEILRNIAPSGLNELQVIEGPQPAE